MNDGKVKFPVSEAAPWAQEMAKKLQGSDTLQPPEPVVNPEAVAALKDAPSGGETLKFRPQRPQQKFLDMARRLRGA